MVGFRGQHVDSAVRQAISFTERQSGSNSKAYCVIARRGLFTIIFGGQSVVERQSR